MGQVTVGIVGKREEDSLSGRKVEVLRLVESEATDAGVARAPYISEGTVKNHVYKMLRRLGMRGHTRLALYAPEHDHAGRRQRTRSDARTVGVPL